MQNGTSGGSQLLRMGRQRCLLTPPRALLTPLPSASRREAERLERLAMAAAYEEAAWVRGEEGEEGEESEEVRGRVGLARGEGGCMEGLLQSGGRPGCGCTLAAVRLSGGPAVPASARTAICTGPGSWRAAGTVLHGRPCCPVSPAPCPNCFPSIGWTWLLACSWCSTANTTTFTPASPGCGSSKAPPPPTHTHTPHPTPTHPPTPPPPPLPILLTRPPLALLPSRTGPGS